MDSSNASNDFRNFVDGLDYDVDLDDLDLTEDIAKYFCNLPSRESSVQPSAGDDELETEEELDLKADAPAGILLPSIPLPIALPQAASPRRRSPTPPAVQLEIRSPAAEYQSPLLPQQAQPQQFQQLQQPVQGVPQFVNPFAVSQNQQYQNTPTVHIYDVAHDAGFAHMQDAIHVDQPMQNNAYAAAPGFNRPALPAMVNNVSFADPPPRGTEIPQASRHAPKLTAIAARRWNPPQDRERQKVAAKGKHRKIDLEHFDYYHPLPMRDSWSTSLGQTIRYSAETGEFDYKLEFNNHQFRAYLDGCIQLGMPVTLTVRQHPFGDMDRLPHRHASLRCRYANCCRGPQYKHTIDKGFWTVAIDEHYEGTSNGTYSPYHVAGHFHLYCLEQMFDLGELSKLVTIMPENRDFPKEQVNKLSLSRDSERVQYKFDEWFHDTRIRVNLAEPFTMRNQLTFNNSLAKALTVAHLSAQPKSRQIVRDKRDGVDVKKHLGNLEYFVTGKNEQKRLAAHAREAAAGANQVVAHMPHVQLQPAYAQADGLPVVYYENAYAMPQAQQQLPYAQAHGLPAFETIEEQNVLLLRGSPVHVDLTYSPPAPAGQGSVYVEGGLTRSPSPMPLSAQPTTGLFITSPLAGQKRKSEHDHGVQISRPAGFDEFNVAFPPARPVKKARSMPEEKARTMSR